MERFGYFACILGTVSLHCGKSSGNTMGAHNYLPDFSPCHTNIIANAIADLRGGPLTSTPVTINTFNVTLGAPSFVGAQYIVNPEMPISIDVISWRGPPCWVHVLELEPISPVFASDDMRRQITAAISATTVVFSYDFKPSQKFQTIQKCRLGITNSYLMIFSHVKELLKQNKLLSLILKSFSYVRPIYNKQGKWRIIVKPILQLNRFTVIFMNPSQSKNEIYKLVYICAYCEPRSFTEALGNSNLTKKSLLDWTDRMISSSRHNEWVITPTAIANRHAVTSRDLLWQLIFRKPDDHLLLRSPSMPQISFENYIVQTLENIGNITFQKNLYPVFPKDMSPSVSVNTNPIGLQQETVNYKEPHIYRPEEFVVTSSDALNFLTCFSIETRSLNMYIVPFNKDLWITLSILVPVMAIILHIYVRTQLERPLTFSTHFMMFSSLVEHSYAIPSKLLRKIPFRIVAGLWFLMVTIFTNGYKGAGISELIYPLPKESITHFDNITAENPISNGNISFSNLKNGARILTKGFFPQMLPNNRDFRILSAVHGGTISLPYSHRADMFRFTKTYFVDQLLSFMKARGWGLDGEGGSLSIYFNLSDHLENLVLRLVLPTNMFLSTSLYVKYKYNHQQKVPPLAVFGSANEIELIKCNDDLFVYADMESLVNSEHEYLSRSYPWIRFYKGTQVILRNSFGWHFSTQGNREFVNSFKTLVSSGIYWKLREMYIFKLYQIRQRDTRKRTSAKWSSVQPIHISGNIHTIFLIYLLLISLILPYVVFEARMRLYNLCRSHLEKIRKLFMDSFRLLVRQLRRSRRNRLKRAAQ